MGGWVASANEFEILGYSTGKQGGFGVRNNRL